MEGKAWRNSWARSNAFGEDSSSGWPQGERKERSRLMTARKQVGRNNRSRILPRRVRDVRVARSSTSHLRQTRDIVFRVRVSVTKENMLVSMTPGKSWIWTLLGDVLAIFPCMIFLVGFALFYPLISVFCQRQKERKTDIDNKEGRVKDWNLSLIYVVWI